MFPATSRRVPLHTTDAVNERIRRETEERVARFRGASQADITRRLQEWDTERTLETNAASLSLAGCVLAATVDRRWVYLPMVVTGFLLQHAVQGWCPPLPVIRRLGVRTMREIDEERMALKALRGDFAQLRNGQSSAPSAAELLNAAHS
ncbi:MAG: hypothetical protein KDA45_11735 [Planctomycetales bacterium]|nr:hypothetical protein [Planctomycetales bacterium]